MFCRLHWLALLVNLALAFFESPSSFSVTSDVRYNPQRIVFPRYALLIVEGLTLLWFLVYICTKVGTHRLSTAESSSRHEQLDLLSGYETHPETILDPPLPHGYRLLGW